MSVRKNSKSDSMEHDALLQDRAIRLFKYLRELALLKSKSTRDLSAYDSVIWFHKVPDYKGCFSILSTEPSEVHDEIWLEIKKPKEPDRPLMPSSCSVWFEDNSDRDPLVEPKLRDEISSNDSLIPNRTERLVDSPKILQEWQYYIENHWLPWSEMYKSWKAANDVYFSLFSVHEQLKKLGEQYELVLGIGLINWETPNNQRVKRHIIVGDVYLTFDADRAKFVLQGAPEGTKLRFETDMIESSNLPSLDQQEELEDMLSLVQESPWNKDEIDKILRSWIQSISPDGLYSSSLVPPEKCTNKPTITFSPAIILRKRTQRSQVQCFTKIIEQINESAEIPSGVQIICEISESVPSLNDNDGKEDSKKRIQEVLYLPLPVNEEQIQIVQQAENRRGILVQGPPGTGKSHTIANLICHLLAQGKRVLVTSQTPRALRVLKDKIPKEVSALCVTLLGNDQAARRELEESVQGINQKYSEWNPEYGAELIKSLESELYKIKKKTADDSRLLREMREIDTYQHQVADSAYSGTAQQIACKVVKEQATLDWLPDDIQEDDVCPLSNSEFLELVQLYRALPDEYCNDLKKKTVDLTELPEISSFIKIIDNERIAKENLQAQSSRLNSSRLFILKKAPEDRIKSLSNSIDNLIAATRSVKQRFRWITRAISDVLSENDTPWKRLRDFLGEHLKEVNEQVAIIQSCRVEYPQNIKQDKLYSDAKILYEYLDNKGKLGLIFLASKSVKNAKYITQEVYVDGEKCLTADHVDMLLAYLECNMDVQQMWSALAGFDDKEEGSLIVQVGYLEERLEALDIVINLEDFLNNARDNIRQIEGLAEPQWHKIEELEEMILDIKALETDRAFRRSNLEVEEYIQKVRTIQSNPKSHKLNNDILKALEERDVAAMAKCIDNLEAVDSDRKRLKRRNELEKRLKAVSPTLSSQLQKTCHDEIWYQRASNFELVWAWERADAWLVKFNKEHNKSKLEKELLKLSQDERATISKLAAEKAWEKCLQNLTEYQRSNLIAWEQAMRKIGKGTGKYAPMWRKRAQSYMDECKGSIPAWIMPLYRVFETVNPESESFDVVIIDEASQTGPEGLVIQYLAKQCIVVGDPRQISPDAVGTDQVAVNSLIEKYLVDIPFKDLYDPQTSLFAHAAQRFGGRVVLREHFRCMPEIIQFSNNLCYNATPLKPLRQYPPKRLEPILVRYVKEGFREGQTGRAINRPEADELISTIAKICNSSEYKGKTIGIISLQGEDQAKYIESKLLQAIAPTEIEDRRIVCGDAYAFQGDERDIILLSMVAAPNERIGPLVREADERRFNVAASRAKDQVILFHTATLNDLHPECMRHKLLEYYLNPDRQTQIVDLSLCQSQFEKEVCQAIIDKGYKVIPQYKVAGYYIDLVVEGIKNQLAVECDGDEWHGIEQYENDVARQRILERCGWRFWRIRGCEYYRNPKDSLESLWKTLHSMGIRRLGEVEPEDVPLTEQKQQLDSIIDIGRTNNEVFNESSAIEQNEEDRTAAILEEIDKTYQRSIAKISDVNSREKPSASVSPSEIADQNDNKLRPTSNSMSNDSEFAKYGADFFFSLSHWMKVENKLQPWQRGIIFSIGKYLLRGWTISEKQEKQAQRIIQQMMQAGFSEAIAKQITNQRNRQQ